MRFPIPRPARPTWWSWWLLILGTTGFSALWVLLALGTSRQHAWMAVVGALDVAWLLRLGRWPSGVGRMAAAMLATAAIVVLANFWIAAAELGTGFGLPPWDSAQKLGAFHAWTLALIANGPLDLLLVVLAVALAGWLSR